MADNVEADPGSGGVTFATDDIGGVHYPRSKVVWGPDGTANDADVASGKPLPVQLRASGGTELALATAAKQDTAQTALDAIKTAVEALDNAVAGSELQVDIVSLPTVDTELTTADLDTGAGTDTRAVVGLVGSASGGGQLIPGSATDGLLVNLGANNDVTVSGTVTANAGTDLNTSALALETGGNLAAVATSLAVLDDWDSNDRAKVSPIVGQDGVAAGAGAVGATVQRTTLASDDPAVTSLAIMDDWDESDRAKVNPIVGQAGVAAGVGASGATTQRVVLANAHGKTLKSAVVSLSASGNIVAAAGASKSIRVYAIFAQSRNDSMTLQVTDGSGGSNLSARMAFNTREGVSRSVNPPAWFWKTTDNTALYASISGTGTVDIEVQYWDDDAA